MSAADGLPITFGNEILIQKDGQWVPFPGDVGGSLMSGSIQRFRISREGFSPALYSLAVQPFQSRLRIDCELVPHPVAILVPSELGNVKLYLDGIDTYLEWGRSPQRRPVPRPTGEGSELRIAPGRHMLSVQVGNTWVDYPFTIESAHRATLVVESVGDKREIRIREISRTIAEELER